MHLMGMRWRVAIGLVVVLVAYIAIYDIVSPPSSRPVAQPTQVVAVAAQATATRQPAISTATPEPTATASVEREATLAALRFTVTPRPTVPTVTLESALDELIAQNCSDSRADLAAAADRTQELMIRRGFNESEVFIVQQVTKLAKSGNIGGPQRCSEAFGVYVAYHP